MGVKYRSSLAAVMSWLALTSWSNKDFETGTSLFRRVRRSLPSPCECNNRCSSRDDNPMADKHGQGDDALEIGSLGHHTFQEWLEGQKFLHGHAHPGLPR